VFLGSALVTASTALLSRELSAQSTGGFEFTGGTILGHLNSEEGSTPIPNARWYTAESAGDGIAFSFPAGTLSGQQVIFSDMLLDGSEMIVFHLELQEGDKGRVFVFRFSGLNQCSFRVRLPLDLVDQNRWGIEREGAFLKPRCSGDRVDLKLVDRMKLVVERKAPKTVRWCMTTWRGSGTMVEQPATPILTKGPLLDEMGQSRLHDWPAKTRNPAELGARVLSQVLQSAQEKWPAKFSAWGGWAEKKLGEGSGFFRTHHDGSRWWLADPDGYAFWSAGMDCVRVDTTARYDGIENALSYVPDAEGPYGEILKQGPDSREGKYINYLALNLIRALGQPGWRPGWARIALGELKRLRFNTVGNWSEWEWARKAKFPYVRPMSFSPKKTELVYRDFPDVFHPDFQADADEYAAQLSDTAADPAFIGYFLMNEPTWGFSSETPAAGMLFNKPQCASRTRLAEFLKQKYQSDSKLKKAWGIPVSFNEIASGSWSRILPAPALADLEAFSTVMADKYFSTLSSACRKVDPNHLNLGMRWAGLPPAWTLPAMKTFDVFSMNCYRERVPSEVTQQVQTAISKPTIIGEWHFGALDVGLPSSGIGHLHNQADRAKAYRVYLEDAAANPNCVGAHWFTLYDESAIGRFDGENYNIGFLDVCNRPYEELSAAAIRSHESMYEIAAGQVKPFDDVPEYLPNLY